MRAILTYHSIDGSGSPISVDPQVFHRHVAWLTGGEVDVVPLETLPRLPDERNAVALTFDDGFQNFSSEAAPRLAEHGLPATLFVVSGHVGGSNAWGGSADLRIPTMPLLDWDALGRLAESGVALGGHSHTHARLTQVATGDLHEELEGCRQQIVANTGYRPRAFAYPYGATDPEVAAAVGRVFTIACTTELRVLRPDDVPLLLPRLDMYYFNDAAKLRAWGTAGFRRRLWARRTARQFKETVMISRRFG